MSNLKNLVRLNQSKYSGYAKDSSDLYFIKDKGYIMNNGVAYGDGFVNAEYVSGSNYHKIVLTTASGNTVEIDCEQFIVDGMVEDVKLITIKNFTASDSYAVGDFVNRERQIYECIKAFPAGTSFGSEYFTKKSTQDISAGNYLYVDFNTASGKQDIFIPLTDIFNPANYYTKSEINTNFAAKSHTHGNITNDGKISRPSGASSDSIAPYDQIVVARLVDGQEGKVYRSGIVFNPQSGSDTTALSQKGNWVSIQTPLTFDDNPTSGSTNPVKSGGVYDSLKGKVDKPTQNDGWVLKYQSESLYAHCSPTSSDTINVMFDYLPLMASHTPGTEVVVTIYFTAPITASNPKLHAINAGDPTGFTAPIKYQGQALQPNTILAGDVYNFVYDFADESWNLVGCIGPRIIDVPD